MQTVTLFKFGEVAEVELPFPPGTLIGNRTLLYVNDQLLVKTAQATTPEGQFVLLVRPVAEIPGVLEGEAAVEAEHQDAFLHGAGWLDYTEYPLQVVWEKAPG